MNLGDEQIYYYEKPNQPGVLLTIPNFEQAKEPTYPSQWFDSNPGKKPPIKTEFKVLNIKDILTIIKTKLENGLLKSTEATAYILSYCKANIEFKSSKEWKSFDRVIAAVDETITPLNLVDVEWGTSDVTGTQTTTADEHLGKYLLAFILCMYRIGRAIRPDYKAILIEKSKRILESSGGKTPVNYTILANNYNCWVDDVNYCRAVAMFDMFMEYTGDIHRDYQTMRFGSKPAQYLDCGALLAGQKISKALGFDFMSKISLYIRTQGISKAMKRFSEPRQEMKDINSYFPYMREMGLVKRSPYSTNANPEFHLFVHAAGAAIGNPWSLNAQMGELADAINSCSNGLMMALVRMGENTTRQYYGEVATLDEKKSLGLVKQAGVSLSSCKNAKMFHKWVDAYGLKITDELRDFCIARFGDLNNLREGSVGLYIKNHFTK